MNIFVPLPNQPAGKSIFNSPTPTTGDQFMFSIDHNMSSKQRLYGRVFKDENDLRNTGNLPLITNFIDYTTRNVAVNHTYFLSPKLVNSVQFTFAESNFRVGPFPLAGTAAGVTAQSLGININRGGLLPDGKEPPALYPDASVTGYFSGGQESDQPPLLRTYHLTEAITYYNQRHVVKCRG